MRHFIDIVTTILLEASTPSHHGIEGLPDDVRISAGEIHRAIARGNGTVFRAVARPGDKEGHYRVALHPTNPGRAVPYEMRPGGRYTASYYDPDLADIETINPGEEYLEMNIPRPKPHTSETIDRLPESDILYRGMSAEEYAAFQQSGQIKSLGAYNFETQEGLTYWSTDPRMAVSYANSFAPRHFKATVGHPCYVVAAHRPAARDIRHVPGTGEDEVGVARAISDAEVVAVWHGSVYDQTGDEYELSPVTHYDHMDGAVKDGDTHRVKHGGYASRVVWERIR